MPNDDPILAKREAGDPGTSRTFAPWRQRLHTIIFEADTPAGALFDLALLVAIILSTLAVMLETVKPIDEHYHTIFRAAEWVFTVLFTVEYVLRLICVRSPRRYAWSFYGIVDLVAVLPTYISLLVPGAQSLLVVRALRLLRIFRILKLARFLADAGELRYALWQSRGKIVVFLFTVITVVSIMGAAMYLVERDTNPGFRNIPQSMYWAIVTMTTVGYGDVTPITPLGKILASLIILFGYSMIVVPTGFVTAEFVAVRQKTITTRACPSCTQHGHDPDAHHCKWCGAELHPAATPN